MKIAVVSDTHDNIWKLDRAFGLMDDAKAIIHCGDLCSPFMITHLANGAGDRPVHIVWGNNEGDPRMISQVAAGFPCIHLHGQFAHLELDHVRIGVNHYPEIARPLAQSGSFDLVCYGHDHTAHSSLVGDCRLLNPGELMGMKGPSTFAWYDTATRQVEFTEVG